MSDLISVENVNSVISNINEDNNTFKSDKTYNIDYDINERLGFLQNKYKDYDFNINSYDNNFIKSKKNGSKYFLNCCKNFDCITVPSFCIEGETKPTYCSPCAQIVSQEENILMIDVKNKKCIKCKEKHPSFCKIGGTKATHCGPCAKIVSREENIEMVNIRTSKCIKCKEKYPSFCKIGETKATHCGSCAQIVSEEKNIEMIAIYAKNKKCIICNKTLAHFAKNGETKATHCGKCKEDKMEDIKHQKCKNIINGIQCKTIANLKKYKGYCSGCFYDIFSEEVPIYNNKIKEKTVVDFIKLIYTQEIREKKKIIDIRFDKHCGNTKKLPDIVIICESYVIVIEVDEKQHKHMSNKGQLYSKENEENKMKLIKEYYKSINKKTIYIRFNPDDYITKNKQKIKSPWKEDETRKLVLIDETDWKNRLEILKQKIDYYLKKKVIKNNSTNYLFYNGFNN